MVSIIAHIFGLTSARSSGSLSSPKSCAGIASVPVRLEARESDGLRGDVRVIDGGDDHAGRAEVQEAWQGRKLTGREADERLDPEQSEDLQGSARLDEAELTVLEVQADEIEAHARQPLDNQGVAGRRPSADRRRAGSVPGRRSVGHHVTACFGPMPRSMPPPTMSSAPVIELASSEARKTQAVPTSRGVPLRPSHCIESR